MTKHFKLENGDIIEFTGDEERVAARGFGGRIIGISVGDDKTCFIFRNETDILRFYLDNDGRPMSRLLILLVSRLTSLRDSPVHVISIKGETPGSSRLHSVIVDNNTECEAPYHLPAGYAIRNRERMRMVLSVLEYSESSEYSDADLFAPAETDFAPAETETMTAGEAAEHAPIVVGGLDHLPEGQRGITVEDTRELTLVKNWPLAIICVKNDDIRTEDAAFAQIRTNPNVSVISQTFVTKKERTMFVEGFKAAAVMAWGYFFYPIVERERVNAAVQAYADRLEDEEEEG